VVGDWQGVGAVAARPRQEMPNLEDPFAENRNQKGLPAVSYGPLWDSYGTRGVWWVIGTAVDGVGAVAARPRQEMPNLEDPFAENLNQEHCLQPYGRVCTRERRSSSAVV
jgi:hypothetical protein